MESRPSLLFLTNSVYGDSTYEMSLWMGAYSQASESGQTLFTLSGGQLVPDPRGGVKVPFLFQLARQVDAAGCLINAGTLQQGVAHQDLEGFVASMPHRHKVATAIQLESAACVIVDNYTGMRAMIEHLVTVLGRKKIVYISGPYNNSEALDRLRAYKDVLTSHGMPIDDELIFEGTWNAPSGIAGMQKIISAKVEFDAVACANDLMAVAVLEDLERRGIAVPGAVTVSGFDDNEAARFCVPQLSTVFQPISELGATAVRSLVRRIGGQPATKLDLVPARIVLRGSAPAEAYRETGIDDQASLMAGKAAESLIASLVLLRSQPGTTEWEGAVVELVEQALGSSDPSVASRLKGLLKTASSRDLGAFPALMRKIRKAMETSIRTPQEWNLASRLHSELMESHRDFQILENFQRGKKTEALMSALVAANRALNEVSRLNDLEDAMAQSLGACGVSTCHIVLFDATDTGPRRGRRVASLVDGKAARTPQDPPSFVLTRLLDDAVPGGAQGNWIVLPLSFEEQELGYVVMGVSDTLPFLYESLANLIAGILHSLLLIQKIGKAEDLAAKRADRIGELVRPMIQSLEQTGGLAQRQGAVMASLAQTNAETARKIAGMDKPVAAMRQALDQIVGLIGTIDDVSATINVIAINAAIAAARAGSDGKVFGVIAAEIRKLSVQTSANTGQISEFLELLSLHSQSVLEANTETKSVFARLDSEIDHLKASLDRIQDEMAGVNDQAQQVLKTMDR